MGIHGARVSVTYYIRLTVRFGHTPDIVETHSHSCGMACSRRQRGIYYFMASPIRIEKKVMEMVDRPDGEDINFGDHFGLRRSFREFAHAEQRSCASCSGCVCQSNPPTLACLTNSWGSGAFVDQ